MARPGFLNDNEARAYPLAGDPPDMLAGELAARLPYATIVDFGCLVGLDAGFDGRMHSVWLQAVSREVDSVTFDFRCDAPGLAGMALRFSRSLFDPEFACSEAEAVPLAPGGPESPCDAVRDDPLWEGFLVTGLLGDLAALITSGEGLVAGDEPPAIEPALVQNLALGYVRTMNLANEDRTRAHAPEGCSEASSESLGDPVEQADQYAMIVNATCLHGPQTVREGYNCTIRQNARDNSLTISAAVAAGAGEPCDEVKLADRETPPPGSSLLTGGPACDELVNSINGLTGSVLNLVPRRGVRIAPSTSDPHTLVVDFDLHDLTICDPDEVESDSLPG